MQTSLSWEMIGALVGALSALAAAPLTIIAFYVRAIRDDQRHTAGAFERQIGRLEADLRGAERVVEDIQRAYTTKEEWLRETMLARQQLERLGELLARLQADTENLRGLATQFGRATHAIIELADHLAGRLSVQG